MGIEPLTRKYLKTDLENALIQRYQLRVRRYQVTKYGDKGLLDEKNAPAGGSTTVREISIEGQYKLLIVTLTVLLLVLVSALGVVYSSYKNRQLFSDLQQQSYETMHLEEEWGRLLLEQSTWASFERIERLAKSELNMVEPNPLEIKVVSKVVTQDL